MPDKKTPVIIGADHFGLPLKTVLVGYLRDKGYPVDDIGVDTADPVDYPDIAVKLARTINAGKYNRGILICGTGAGMAIAANKVPGVRAAFVNDPYTAERARASNNAQVITFGSQITGSAVAEKLVDIWLNSEFQGGRSAPKVAKIDRIDAMYRRQD